MKPAEIRAKGEKELQKLLEEKKGTLFGLKIRLVTGQLKETSQIRETKRDIARLLTIANEEIKNAAAK